MTDPICDMSVEPVSAAGKSDYEGRTYYFCSVHCKKLFDSDPLKHAAAAQARKRVPQQPQHEQHHPIESKPGLAGATYTCPMDPEVRQPSPGPCPKCGMALEPLDMGASLTKTE